MPNAANHYATPPTNIFSANYVAGRGCMVVGPPRVSLDGYRRRHLVNAGESLRLGCPVVGHTSPIITWYKDGEEVTVGWERYRVRHDSLQVRDTEPEDSGVFVCQATNGFGSVDVKYLVLVLAGLPHTVSHICNR